jgi:hypothetical protein
MSKVKPNIDEEYAKAAEKLSCAGIESLLVEHAKAELLYVLNDGHNGARGFDSWVANHSSAYEIALQNVKVAVVWTAAEFEHWSCDTMKLLLELLHDGAWKADRFCRELRSAEDAWFEACSSKRPSSALGEKKDRIFVKAMGALADRVGCVWRPVVEGGAE